MVLTSWAVNYERRRAESHRGWIGPVGLGRIGRVRNM